MNIFEFFGKDSGLFCGYCNSKNGFVSFGMWTFIIEPSDYEKLINKGWRRSGKYLYKPVMYETCCPQYPIRCFTKNFQLSKSKRKIFKKINKVFISIKANKTFDGSKGDIGNNISKKEIYNNTKKVICLKKLISKKRSKSLSASYSIKKLSFSKRSCSSFSNLLISDSILTENETINLKSCNNIDLRRKTIIKDKKMDKRLEKCLKEVNEIKINDILTLNDCVKLSNIKITLESALSLILNKDKSMEEFKIYYLYQIKIHRDKPEDLSLEAFTEFLIDSPIKNESIIFGSFHMQYRYLTELIAVGVIDILPHCLSSVYFFYNPKYYKCSLGIYSILCEINLAQELSTIMPNIMYHYSGYYINNCRKMNYKSQFKPSFLCCPVTEKWIPFDVWQSYFKAELLEKSQYKENNKEYIANSNTNSKILEYLLGCDVYKNSKITLKKN